MSLLRRILRWLGLRKENESNHYRLAEDLRLKLFSLAMQEGRTENEVIEEILAANLQKRSKEYQLKRRWDKLSQREQDVTALVCLGYTNRQIAAILGLSIETVKSHLSRILFKLNLQSRKQLRIMFSSWDFSAWEDYHLQG